MIAQRFVQALLPPAKFATQKAVIAIACTDLLGHKESLFSAKGQRLVEPGWMQFFADSDDRSSLLPQLQSGDEGKVAEIDLKATATKPPSRNNTETIPREIESVGKLERDPEKRKRLKDCNGIGTPATRKAIIDTLLTREYIRVEKSIYYPTMKGRELIRHVPAWLSTPETTAIWEGYLVRLCELTDDIKASSVRDQFVERQVSNIERLIQELIHQYAGNLGERRRGGSSTPTPRMINRIKEISAKHRLTINSGVLTDYSQASAFLDTHQALFAEPGARQIALVRSIAAKLPDGVGFDESILTDRKACSEFISRHIASVPPSDAQLAFARKLQASDKSGEPLPQECITSRAACGKYIDRLMGKEAPARSTSGGTKKSAGANAGRRSAPSKRKSTGKKKATS